MLIAAIGSGSGSDQWAEGYSAGWDDCESDARTAGIDLTPLDEAMTARMKRAIDQRIERTP
jgi:hypothetical protein